jgi:hypothetical protein
METRLLKAREILTDFLKVWPLSRVRGMALTNYTDTGNPNTFCRWVERRTEDIGSVYGYNSSKFGIYKRGNDSEAPGNYISDDLYSWVRYYGNSEKDRNKAFQGVKQDVINIIEAAQAGRFSDIDKIHLNSLARWKIAFLYSNEQLVPIFKKDVLEAAAIQQRLTNTKGLPISQLQKLVFDNRPSSQNLYQYADDLLHRFGNEEENDISYYLIGSKYEDSPNYDMFPLMEEYSVVSTGFAWKEDLAHLYRAKEKTIVDELKGNGEPSKSYNALRQLLQLKPGDIVAVKSTGSPKGSVGFLEIIAYGVVVERENKVYWHSPDIFGHCINVQFITTGLHRQFNLGGYGRTIHSITEQTLIDTLFEGYKKGNSTIIRQKIKKRRRTRKASASKNMARQKRKGSQPYVTNPKHNQIQQLFKEYLEGEFGSENVQLEENNVDIKLLQPGFITFYEVKPYDFAEDCIRGGLGQLLSYSFFDTDKRKKKIRIVGPFPPEEDERELITYLKKSLEIDFDYEFFEID